MIHKKERYGDKYKTHWPLIIYVIAMLFFYAWLGAMITQSVKSLFNI